MELLALILMGAGFAFVCLLPIFLIAAAVSEERPPIRSQEAE